MKIIHTDTDDIENPLRGGQPVRTYEISSRLAARHQIHVLTATYPDCKKQVVRSNVHYERLGITVPGWGLSSHLSYLSRLPSAVKRIDHDLIVEEFTPPFGFCNLQKFTTSPVISMVQWSFFNDWEDRYKLPFEAMMERRAQRYQKRHIIVQTHKMGERFKQLLPEAEIFKIPCGINRSEMQPNAESGDYALFLGRLDIRHKGLDDLLMAWRLLKASGDAIPLWIVGVGQDEAKLKKMVAENQLESFVHFKGRLEGEAKKAALANCKMMVMPSRQETFGLVALEAMASAKPVVAYDIDHLNELLRPEWASLVQLGHVKAFAQQVKLLVQNKNLCINKGASAYQQAQHYLWDNVAQMQENVYEKVVSSHKL